MLVLLKETVVAEHDGEGSIRPEAELTPFLRMRSENRPKTYLLFSQIAKMLAPLWAIAVAEHDCI